MNLVCGARMQRHCFLYFGDGVAAQQRDLPDLQMPEMCAPPFDISEEAEVDVEYQRMEWDCLAERRRRF